MQTDTWGWRARFGVMVIHKDPVAEVEFWALAPPGVTVHAARFESPRPVGSDHYGDDPARLVADSPDMTRGLDYLGQMLLDVICVCFGTVSFFGGFGFDEDFTKEASRKAHGIPVTTAALATTTAMRAAGIRRPFLVMPTWFKSAIVKAAERYFTDAGFSVAGVLSFDLGVGWREMQPWEVYDNGGHWVVRPEDVYQQVRRACPADSDGVVVAGSGFRTIEAIELLEADLGIPVVTSNQASVWHCLRIAGVTAPIAGYGRLLSGASPGAGTPAAGMP